MHSPAYLSQLNDKTAFLRRLFAGVPMPEWRVYPSPERHYRMRAEFRIWHDGENISYAMFEHGKKAGGASVIRITEFPAAAISINRLMPELLAAVSADPVLKNRLYQCEFLSTLSGDMLVTLIYHRKLDETWQTAAEALQNRLGIALIGRSKGQKNVLSRDFVTESLDVGGQTYRYRQPEGAFSRLPRHARMGVRCRRRPGRRPARTLLWQRQLHPVARPPIRPRPRHRSLENLRAGRAMEYLGQRSGQHPHRPPVGRRIYRSLHRRTRIPPP